MIIGSKIVYYENNSYKGIGTSTIIGFCKELPKDVLRKLISTHVIHSYKTLHCPPLSSYEYILSGICIYPLRTASDKKYEVQGSIDNLLSHPLMLSNRSSIYRRSTLKDRINTLNITVLSLPSTNPWKRIYEEIYYDLKDIYDTTQDSNWDEVIDIMDQTRKISVRYMVNIYTNMLIGIENVSDEEVIKMNADGIL